MLCYQRRSHPIDTSYLPVAATAFGELRNYEPEDLLTGETEGQ